MSVTALNFRSCDPTTRSVTVSTNTIVISMLNKTDDCCDTVVIIIDYFEVVVVAFGVIWAAVARSLCVDMPVLAGRVERWL